MSTTTLIVMDPARYTASAPDVAVLLPVVTITVAVNHMATRNPTVAVQPPETTITVVANTMGSRAGNVLVRPPVVTIGAQANHYTTTAPAVKTMQRLFVRCNRMTSRAPRVGIYVDRRPDRLLPRNSTAFERTTLRAGSDRLPVMVREVMDPYKAPVHLLPWLAAHESVDLWYEDWHEDRKRKMVADATKIGWTKGTYAGSCNYLDFVDAEIVDRVSYPSRFVMGRGRIGRTPLGHPAFLARYLVKTPTRRPHNAFVIGRSKVKRATLKTPSQEPFKRACQALRVAKAPETEIRVDFQHKRRLQLGDAPLLDGTHRLGDFVDRFHLSA